MKQTWRMNGLCVCLALWLLSGPAWGLIQVHKGNDPIPEFGLPTGAKAVADIPSRLGYRVGPPFGGGEYYFTYQSQGSADFNRALALFSQIRVPRLAREWLVSLTGDRTTLAEHPLLLLVVHDQTDKIDRNEKERVDWSFTVWSPANYYRLFSSPKGALSASHPNYQQPLPPPRIDVYVGGDSPIQWAQVKVPATLKVIDTRTTPDVAQQGGTVTGAVYDMGTHKVIPRAQVRIVKTSRSAPTEILAQDEASERGTFELAGIESGYYQVHVMAEGYVARDWRPFDNRSGKARLDADILLCRSASLTGHVVDQAGQPVSELTVTTRELIGQDGRGYACVNAPQAVTDTNGQFVLKGVPEGYAHLRCRAPSIHQETSIFELYPVSRRPGPRDPEITLIVTGTGIIQGRVVDAEGNPPTRQFIAELNPKGGSRRGSWGSSGRIKKDGSFDIKGIPPGEYILTAQPNPMREGEATDPKPIVVIAGKTIEVTVKTDHAHGGGTVGSEEDKKVGGQGPEV